MARNNGRDPLRALPTIVRPTYRPAALRDTEHSALAALIEPLDPDMGYEDWLRVAMALHHATDGCEYGLIIFDEWSMQGSKYPGFKAIKYKWFTLSTACERPITIRSVIWMLKQQGHDPVDFNVFEDSGFDECECLVIDCDDMAVSND